MIPGSFFDNFLIATLDAALAFVEVDAVAEFVS